MEDAKAKIKQLLAQGGEFTFQTFASRGGGLGYPSAHSSEWITWTTRVDGLIQRLFEPGSAPVRLVKAAGRVGTIGNGPDAFQQCSGHYLGALRAGLDALEEDTYGEVVTEKAGAEAPRALSNKVFVVHGHDEKAKQELELLLVEMGLEPIVLHRQADGGRTLIEKFEFYSDVGFAFVLMTPDEVAYLAGEESRPDAERNKEQRARPNVIFEFGFFVGRLGRAKTCCLYRGDVVLPSDLSGLIYKRFDRSVEEVAWSLARELREAGYKLR